MHGPGWGYGMEALHEYEALHSLPQDATSELFASAELQHATQDRHDPPKLLANPIGMVGIQPGVCRRRDSDTRFVGLRMTTVAARV